MMFRFSENFRFASHCCRNFRSFFLSCLSVLANRKSTIVSPASLRYPVDKEEAARRGFAWEMKFSEIPLRTLGLWPMDDKCARFKNLLCLVVMILYGIPSFIRVFFTGSDDPLDRPLDVLIENTPLLYATIQFSMFRFKSRGVKILLTTIYEDWRESVNLSEDDRKPMFLYGGKTRMITALLIGFFFMCCMGYYAEPLLTMLITGNMTMRLPNKGLYPFDTAISPNYQIIYVTQTFLGVLCPLMIASIDGFFMLSVFHGCGQLAVLCKIIGRFEGKTRHDRTSNDYSKRNFTVHCSCLRCIVDRHVSLSKYAKTVDDVFNDVIMLRLATTTLHFCGVGSVISMSKDSHKFYDLSINAIYMGTMVFNFYLYCWIGEQLLEEGLNIGRAVYMHDWHRQEPKVAKTLMMPILRSRIPLKVTAGRFFVMSHSCFKEWFMNSMGYLSVLLAIRTHT